MNATSTSTVRFRPGGPAHQCKASAVLHSRLKTLVSLEKVGAIALTFGYAFNVLKLHPVFGARGGL